MSLSWDISEVKNVWSVCWMPASTLTGPLPPDCVVGPDGSTMRMHPVTRAIIASTPSVGLSRVETPALEEFLYRLDSLFDAGVQFWWGHSEDGPYPRPLTRRHLQRHIGLKTTALDISNAKFDALIRQIRQDNQRAPEFPRVGGSQSTGSTGPSDLHPL